jgi:hypothetical protein
MVAKRKVVKRRKQPAPQQGGVNPLGVGLGAGIGAGIGRTVGGYRGRAQAVESMRQDVRRTPVAAEQIKNAVDEYEFEYGSMPRVKNANKIVTYNQILKETGNATLARQRSGMSKEDVRLYNSKRRAKETLGGFRNQQRYAKEWNSGGPELNDVMGAATNLRKKRMGAAGKRSGAIKGGAAGAALSLIAQLVATEMRKKKP